MHNQNVIVWEHCKAFFEVQMLNKQVLFQWRNSNFPFNLIITFKAIGSPDMLLSKTQPIWEIGHAVFIKFFYILEFALIGKEDWFGFIFTDMTTYWPQNNR